MRLHSGSTLDWDYREIGEVGGKFTIWTTALQDIRVALFQERGTGWVLLINGSPFGTFENFKEASRMVDRTLGAA